jgi:repressor LexA
MELTPIQRRVFEFVRDLLEAGKPAPTSREIAAAFRWRGKRAAEYHVEALVKYGWLVREPGKARSLRLGPAANPTLRSIAEIPILGSVPAGLGEEKEQVKGESIPVTAESIGFKPSARTFALRVSGQSMIGKHICDGDIVLLEQGPEPRAGEIVAALIDRESTLKTFIIKNGKPFLKAENPNYPDLMPCEELMIQGVFCALIRKVRE